jgi:hypothetical protein
MEHRGFSMLSRMLLLTAFLVAGIGAVGAQSIWTSSELIASSNGQYVGRVNERANGSCQIEMLERSSGQVLWSQWIDWGKRSYGIASDDGRTFAILNAEYAPELNLILVSHADGQEAYGPANIVIGRQFLSHDGDKLLWIKDIEKNATFEYGPDGKTVALNLRAVDGRIFRISL